MFCLKQSGRRFKKHVLFYFQAADYLTGGMLGEQYKSMREISGLLSKLAKMTKEFGDLGELVFDKDFKQA